MLVVPPVSRSLARSVMRRAVACLALVALLASPVVADLYMQNPRGSNNRLNEQTATRDNNNRMFDSQVSGTGNGGAARASK